VGFDRYLGGMFATMQILRTADEHFGRLPEFPYLPRYCEHPSRQVRFLAR
jgi:hypothetical protein